jgi:hypothetical protein
VLLFIPHEILPSNIDQHFAKVQHPVGMPEFTGAHLFARLFLQTCRQKKMPHFAQTKQGISS